MAKNGTYAGAGGFQNEVQHFIRDWNDGLFYG
jgi:hypothetical protein